ncbi:uncharacterized protein LOC115444266 [Manduca sexta]|uniref:C2H2-type domain-containing protein n=1 Tax=Manduca sexta TaxID=7130 RepID=A0A921Z592_MANSE|nr:uncharacterized protein LOC115444266 [Manduca sexta]XP_030025840.1 uncharacterized protein LOC115444266 [Manduca sexta]KAG6451230.1 hypothetical protein O3G_MSEX007019 [Manduca sexta]
MMSKFNKNAIINGIIDYFCLVCETYFASEEAAEQHIQKQIHKKSLENCSYLEKYKSDCIRKVKAGYFCEYCNILLSTGTKVNLHIDEKMHQDNKGIALLKYVEDDVMAFNDVVIKEEAWHGLTGDTCAICNCDVDNFAEHKVTNAHILKLVQGRIQFGPNNYLYRKVDDLSFQCLTCNKILALSAFEKHLNESEHQKNYVSCTIDNVKNDKTNILDNKNDASSVTRDKTSNVTPTSENTVEDSKSNILDAITEFQMNDINIHFESEKAFCKKCYIEVSFNYNEIKKHIAEHKNKHVSPLSTPARVQQNHKVTDMKGKTELNNEINKDLKYITYPNQGNEDNIKTEAVGSGSSVGATASDVHQSTEPESVCNLETFADNNKISYIAGNSTAHCTACDVKLPASLRNWKEHVNGVMHKLKMMPQKRPKNSGAYLPKQQMYEFIKEVVHIENICGHDVVINENFCLTAMSFVMIKEENDKLRCLYCETTFDEIDIKYHLRNPTHDGAMEHTPVVLQDPTEFVREIRPGQYHCGYCHLVVGDWSDFEDHAECEDHLQRKKTMMYRLDVHKPVVLEHRRKQQLIVLSHIMKDRLGIPLQWLLQD